jgi:hypothetical protein
VAETRAGVLVTQVGQGRDIQGGGEVAEGVDQAKELTVADRVARRLAEQLHVEMERTVAPHRS